MPLAHSAVEPGQGPRLRYREPRTANLRRALGLAWSLDSYTHSRIAHPSRRWATLLSRTATNLSFRRYPCPTSVNDSGDESSAS